MTQRSFGLLVAVLLFAAGGLRAVTPAKPGFLEGDLKVHSERGVDLADKPSATPDQPSYANYRLMVFSKDHRTEVAQVPIDEHGHYHLSLPPGDYVLDLKRTGRNRFRATAHSFTIASEETVRLNMEIDATFPPPM
jgi:hypothetical protein